MDSTIRLRQLNQAELSGYVSQVVSAILSNVNTTLAPTGKLTGTFYPYLTNPSNYANSGSFATSTDINSAIVTENAYIASNYYPTTNPAGYVGGVYLSGNFCKLSQTGQFYPRTGNPSSFVNSTQTGGFSSVSVNGTPVIFPNFTGVGGTTLSFSGNMVTISGGGGAGGVFVSSGTGINAGLTPTTGFKYGQILYTKNNLATGTHLGISGNYTLFFGTGDSTNTQLENGFVYYSSLQFGNSRDIPLVLTANLIQESPALGDYPPGAYPAKSFLHTYHIYPILGDSAGNLITPGYGEFYFVDDGNPNGYDSTTSNYNVGVSWDYMTTLNIDGFTVKYFKIFVQDKSNGRNFDVAYKTSGLGFTDDNSIWDTPNTDTSLPPIIPTLTPSLYLNSIRNVGVKNNNPQYPLDVSGTTHSSNFLALNKIDTANGYLNWDYVGPDIPYGPLTLVDWHNNHLLSPNGGSPAVDWRNYQLGNGGGTTLDWGSSNLYDSAGTQSADWNNRSLNDAASQNSIDWGSRYLYDSANHVMVDWQNTQLKSVLGVQTVNWGNFYLLDSTTKISVDWYNRYLGDFNGNQVLVWNNTGVTAPKTLTVTSGIYGYGGINTNTVNPVGSGSGTFAIVHSGATINGSHVVTATETGNFLTLSSLTNGAGGSGLYVTSNGSVKSIAGGTGVNLSGNATSLTINLWLGQIFQTGLQSDVNIPSANTWVNVLSGSFGAGTYMIDAQTSLTTNTNTTTRLYAKLYDGTNSPWASCGQVQGAISGVTGESSMALSKLISVTGTQSIILAVASSDTGNIARSRLWSVSSTISGNTLGTNTYLNVCRLY